MAHLIVASLMASDRWKTPEGGARLIGRVRGSERIEGAPAQGLIMIPLDPLDGDKYRVGDYVVADMQELHESWCRAMVLRNMRDYAWRSPDVILRQYRQLESRAATGESGESWAPGVVLAKKLSGIKLTAVPPAETDSKPVKPAAPAVLPTAAATFNFQDTGVIRSRAHRSRAPRVAGMAVRITTKTHKSISFSREVAAVLGRPACVVCMIDRAQRALLITPEGAGTAANARSVKYWPSGGGAAYCASTIELLRLKAGIYPVSKHGSGVYLKAEDLKP